MTFLHIGENTAVYSGSIIGIFDLDTTTVSKNTRDFLKNAEQCGRVHSDPGLLPKAFVVCHNTKTKKTDVFLSPVNSVTLKKRAASGKSISE